MNGRQISLVRLLLEHEGFMPLEAYADSLGISSKTVRRDLPQLQQELAAFGADIEKKPGAGIRLRLAPADRERLLNTVAMAGYASASYPYVVWMKRARRIDLALNLLMYSDETSSLSSLAYKYYTGKSSIHGDFKTLESFFEKHRLRPQRSQKGTGIAGDESDIREALVDLLVYLSDNHIDTLGKAELRSMGRSPDNTLLTLLSVFTEDDLRFAEAQLNDVSGRAGYLFDDREFIAICMRLLVAVCRTRAGFSLQDGYRCDADNPLLQNFAAGITRNAEAYCGTKFPPAETAYLYNAFSTTNLAMRHPEGQWAEGTDAAVALAFSEDFWDAFSVVTGINLRASPSLYSIVVAHITQMLHRARLNMPAHNPIVDTLYQDYKDLANACRIICWILAQKFDLPAICIDEICYLVLYIQGEIIANEEKRHILLVSNTPKSVTNLVKQKLLSRHPQWRITICDYAGYLSCNKSGYDLVVSTVVMEPAGSSLPHAFVSPALNAADFGNLEHILTAARQDTSNFLLELIRTAHDISDIGCRVGVVTEDMELIPGADALTITGHKDILFIYSRGAPGQNSCDFVINRQAGCIKKVVISMCEWDFMLFTSKLVYQLDNYPDHVVEEFVNFLMKEM